MRGLSVVVSHADVRPPDLVLLYDRLDPLDHLGFAYKVEIKIESKF